MKRIFFALSLGISSSTVPWISDPYSPFLKPSSLTDELVQIIFVGGDLTQKLPKPIDNRCKNHSAITRTQGSYTVGDGFLNALWRIDALAYSYCGVSPEDVKKSFCEYVGKDHNDPAHFVFYQQTLQRPDWQATLRRYAPSFKNYYCLPIKDPTLTAITDALSEFHPASVKVPELPKTCSKADEEGNRKFQGWAKDHSNRKIYDATVARWNYCYGK